MPNIQIIQMGTLAHGLRIDHINRSANRAQGYYSFTVGDKITTLGDPRRGIYTAENLLDLLIQP